MFLMFRMQAYMSAHTFPYSSLYPQHLCRGVYSFGLSIRPFICSFVRNFVPFVELLHSFTLKQLEQRYLTDHSSESIHIWTIGTLEGQLSFHDSSPQGPCPGVGPEVKVKNTFKKHFSTFSVMETALQIVGRTWLNLVTWTCVS